MIDLFIRKLENSKTLGDEGSLPEEWQSLTEYDFQTIVRNLDKYSTGYVHWKTLATFIILLKSPIATDKNIESYKHDLPNYGSKDEKIGEDAFLKVRDKCVS